jgi:hypothetical protein
MRVGSVSAPLDDVLRIKIDGTTVQTYSEPAAPEATYSLRTVDVSAFADGLSHTVLFEYSHPGTGVSNFVVDNIEINAVSTCTPVVSGNITYQNAFMPPVAVPGVTLNAPGAPAVNGTTDAAGNYLMTGFAPSTAYTVTPSRAAMVSSAPNGIFANDAALIARHVVGLTTLNANQQLAAAVSGGAISSVDAAFVARWIVGMGGGTNQTGQWKFTPANRAYANVNTSQTGQNYTALLMGDVSGDWLSSPVRPAIPLLLSSVIVSAPELSAAPGDRLTLPMRLDGLGGIGVTSYQFDIEFDPKVISPDQLAADLAGTVGSSLSVVSHSPVPGMLKVVVYGAQPAIGNGVYVNLKFSVIAGRGASTPVNITNFRLNDGERPVSTLAGRVNIK